MSKKTIFYALLILSMGIWGVSWSSAKVLSGYGSALSMAFMRNTIMILAFVPFLFFSKVGFRIKASGWKRVFPAGIAFGVYALVFFSGLQHGMASVGGVLVTVVNPIVSFLIGMVIDKFVPSRNQLLGLFIGLIAGTILMDVWHAPEHIFDLGNLLFVLAASIWAVMSKISSKSSHYGHPIVFNFWMYCVATFIIACLVDYSEIQAIVFTADKKFWLNMFFLGVVNTGFATSCYLYATSQIGAEKASTFMFLVPLGAVLSSWAFLGEEILLATLLGGVLGVVSVMIINAKTQKKASQ